MPSYRVYGLGLWSNVAVPGLRPTADQETVDTRVYFGRLPDWISRTPWERRRVLRLNVGQDDHSESGLKVWQSADRTSFLFTYPDGTQFVIGERGGRVWATWPDNMTLEDTATYLLGPVLGFILVLRGVPCLHASAIAVGGRALLLVGPAGAGKSTTAAVFARLGYPVLAEDVSALYDIDGRLSVQPGYPLIRLWPESVKALYGEPDALPLMTPNWDKRYLELAEAERQFQSDPLPLGAVYFLGQRTNDVTAPVIKVLAPAEGLLALVANSYAVSLVDADMRAREFGVFGRVAARVPLRQAQPHTEAARLPQLCETILRDFEKTPPLA